MYLDEKTSGEALVDLGTLRVDRILALANAIERQTLKIGFDMSEWNLDKDNTGNLCGTACCIGGHANIMFGGPLYGPFSVTADLLGIAHKQAYELFIPKGWFYDKNLNDRSRAARVLRHLAKTGKVDWSV